MMAKEQKRQSEDVKSKIRHYRIPVLLYREFYSVVVLADKRSESEIIRALIVDAIRKSKQESRER